MCKALNYLENFLVVFLLSIRCVLTNAFASLVDVFVGIARSTVGIKISAITAAIRKYKSYSSEKKERNHDHIEISAKSKLISIDVLISKSLINSYINHKELVTVNNVLREYNKMKAEIKKSQDFFRIYYINMVNVNRKMYEKFV